MSDIITANRLIDGIVLFQDATGGWVEDFAHAAIYPDAEATKTALALAKDDELRNLIVDAYAVVVELRNGHYIPKALRELIRATGPTTHLDLGKQAQGQAPVLLEKPHVPV
ncbi:DUF2849 domain-containing protein [Methylocapsa sp. S129]|uniref:DUF2849 domain-containing protein n=1 Tax=Methylocapsa sp. S129 TaxID=1641869 RepID=UPI00131A67CB|nr:DUF2849 domain-containing protein [Methylocapsa sp. S129]